MEKMEAASISKKPPSSAEETSYFSEMRLESASTVGFSEPCPYCGNRKRRLLNPPTRSRKKRLVFEPAPPPHPFPPPPPRPKSSPLPSSSKTVGLSLTPSPSQHFPLLGAHPFPLFSHTACPHKPAADAFYF